MRSPPSCRGSNGTAIPIGRPLELRTAIAELARRVARSRCSPPTARTRCCRRCCSPTPGRAARWRRSSRRTRCTATSPGSPGRPSSRAQRGDDFTLDLAEVERVDHHALAARHVPVLAQQPDRAGRAGANVCAQLLDAGAGLVRRRRGVRAVRRLVGARSPGRRRARWSSRGRSPRPGRWPAPGSATSSARRGWSPSSTRWCCRTTSTPPSRSPVGWRCGSSTTWTPGCG